MRWGWREGEKHFKKKYQARSRKCTRNVSSSFPKPSKIMYKAKTGIKKHRGLRKTSKYK